MSKPSQTKKAPSENEMTAHFTDIARGEDFVLTEAAFALPDDRFLWLACGCPSLQDVARPLLPPRFGKRKDPFVLFCGCNSHGLQCDEEQALWADMEAARKAWERSGQRVGDAGFAQAYRPLLRAREAYHAHFGRRYDAHTDALWQEHCRAGQSAERRAA